jgi:hypothetical protein
MAKFDLNKWLRRNPQPTTVMADDQKIAMSGGGRQFRDMVRTIEGLSPKKLTLLDKGGAIIRALDLGTEVEKSEDDEKPKAGGGVNSDNELIVFASLIGEAYDKAAHASNPLITNAMELVQRQGERLAKAEAEIDRLRNHTNKLMLENAELRAQQMTVVDDGEGGILGAIAQGYAAQQMQAAKPTVRAVPTTAKDGGK